MKWRIALLLALLPYVANATPWEVSAVIDGQPGATGIQWWLAENTPTGTQLGSINTIPGPLVAGVWSTISDSQFANSGRTICAVARQVRTRGTETPVNSLGTGSLCQTFAAPPPPPPAALTPPPAPIVRLSGIPPPPPPTGSDPPLSWTDPRFAAVVALGSQILASGSALTDKSIAVNGANASIQCNGSCNLTRVRVNSSEALRVVSGNVVITDSYLEALGSGADHADVIQTYSPGSTGTITLRSTAIVAHTTAATAGLFIADGWKPTLVDIQDSVFWGGPYGMRLHADGFTGAHLRMRNVCFVGPFSGGRFIIDTAAGGGGPPWQIDDWTNVNDCTIQSGQLVRGAAIAKPQ
jgi:hypothetical protein